MRKFCSLVSIGRAMSDHFSPSESVRGMRNLNRDRFTCNVTVPALRLLPKQCSVCAKKFKHLLLKQTGIKRFIDVQDSDKRSKLLLLCPLSTVDHKLFSDAEHTWLKEEGITETVERLTLTYENFTMRSVLSAVLPRDISEVPTSFETVGHIAHLNMREDTLEYKTIIGEVLLDKHPQIKTVVNKVDSIDSSFRFFKMELLAGEDNMLACVKENGCTFKFNFSKVYWNSRLHTEHQRVIDLLGKDEVVVDMFAGVGPFALPAAKKGCVVFANDLNPSSYHHLVENASLNDVTSRVSICNQDGREFIAHSFAKIITDRPHILSKGSHVIMNLPASAIEFLDSLVGILQGLPPDLIDSVPMPWVHCYTFSKSAKPVEDVVARAEHALQTSLADGTCTVHRVRDVAPNKLMMRVSFQLPFCVAYGTTKKGLKRPPISSETTSPKRSQQNQGADNS